MKLSKNFTTEEFIHPDIIKKLGDKRSSNIVNNFLIKQVQLIRDKFGPVIINGKYGGKNFINSGVRKASFYKTLGVIRESYSTHLWCNTADLKFKNITPIEVYDYILNNPNEFPYIVRMENAHKTKTWLHIECGRFRDGYKIEVFNP
jgi:hypothetical protein